MIGRVQRFVGASRLRKICLTYVPYALGIGGNAGFNIALISVLTHRLMPSVYGGYTVSVTVIVLAGSVVGQWLQQSTGRYLTGSAASASSYTKAAVLLGVGAILLALLVLYLLTAVFLLFEPTLGDRLWLICIVAIASQVLFMLVGTMLQAEQRAWSYCIQQTCSGGLKVGLSVLVSQASQRNIGGLLYAGVAAQCAGVIFGAWRAGLFDRTVRHKLRSHRVRMVFRKLQMYGSAMTLWFIFMNLAMYCDRLLVRALAGSAMAGLYGAASTLVVGSVNLVMAPILAATWPQLMAAWNTKNERAASKQLGDLLTYLLCAGVTLVAVVSSVAGPATQLFLGKKYGAASTLLPLLVASAFSFSVGPFFHKPLEFKEKKGTMCALAATALLLNGLLSSLLTPWLGGIGAGVAALLAGVAYCALCTVWGRRIVKWRIRFGLLATVATLAGLTSLATRRLAGLWTGDGRLLPFLAGSLVFVALFSLGLAVVWAVQSVRKRVDRGPVSSNP